mgnify:CR=1 FL=1
MGTIAARKAATIIGHAQEVLAIEMLCSAQAADFKDAAKLAPGTRAAYDVIRSEVGFMEEDRAIYPDKDRIVKMIRDGRIVEAVERTVGTLR